MNSFWSIFVTVVSVASLASYIWLVHINSKLDGKQGESTGHVWDENLEELNNPLPKWWYYTFIGLTLWAIGFVLYYPALGNFAGFGGWTQIKQYEEEVVATDSKYNKYYDRITQGGLEDMAKNSDAIATGRRLFENNCAVCHGIDAKGNNRDGYPNLTDTDWMYGGEPEQIIKTITDGRQGIMPTQLPGLQGLAKSKGMDENKAVNNVAAYVMSLSGNQFSGDASLEDGKVLFEGLCAACHTPAGTGMQALGAPNLTDNIWVHNSGSVQRTIEDSIISGRHGIMPAHKEVLSSAKIKTIAAYVYSLSNDEVK